MGDGNTMISVLGLIIGIIGFATAWQVGRGLKEDIDHHLEATLAAIARDSESTADAVRGTLAAIEKNSDATLKAIEATHRSIKGELQ